MEYKFTKSPWKVIGGWDEKGNGCFPSVVLHGSEKTYRESFGRTGITINCSHDQKDESLMANARLIAASPEMFDLLYRILKKEQCQEFCLEQHINEEISDLIKRIDAI